MRTLQEIQEQAKMSYENYFGMPKAVESQIVKGHDVVLDIEKIEKEVKLQKEMVEKKMESLEILRKQFNDKAKEAYIETFGEEKVVQPLQKKSKDEVYDELHLEKKHLMDEMNALKEKQMKR